VLTELVPGGLVDEIVDRAGRREERVRLLPARVVVYFVLAMCLSFGDGYEEAMRKLVGGLQFLGVWRPGWQVPTTGAIPQARSRLARQDHRQGRGDRVDSPAVRHRPAPAPTGHPPHPRPAVPHRSQGPCRNADARRMP